MERMAVPSAWNWSPARDPVLGSGVYGSVAKLVGATSLGCVAAILGAPLLTRLYDPASFGHLALFVSVVGMLTAPASGRYEFAIPIARTEHDARVLLRLAWILLLVSVGCVGLIADWCGAALGIGQSDGVNLPGWLLAAGIGSLGAFQILRYWHVRCRRFSQVAIGEVTRVVMELAVQVLLGCLAFRTTGLVIGFLAAYFAAAFILMVTLPPSATHRPWLGIKELVRVGRAYSAYPLYSVPSALLNTVGMRAPLVLLAILYGPEAAGWFALADRIFAMPTRVLGSAVSDVLFARAAELVREAPEQLPGLLWSATRRLFGIAVVIMLAGLGAPAVLSRLLGPGWESTSSYCQLLAVPFALRFVSLAVTQLTTYGFNRWQLGWDALRLTMVSGAIFAAHGGGGSHFTAIVWYGLASMFAFILLYLLNVWAILRLAHRPVVA
jgi:O-antigen/teichoic acid export membrane protein